MKNTMETLTAEIENRLGKNPKLYLDTYKIIKNTQTVHPQSQSGFQSVCNMVFKNFKKNHDSDNTNLIEFILVMSHLKDLEENIQQQPLA